MPGEYRLDTYMGLRGAMEENYGALNSPCTKGNAKCCDREIGTTEDDERLIYKAFQEGKIPDSVRQRAAKRLRDNVDKCLFLGDQNECLIYPFRPFVCVEWGGIRGFSNSDKIEILKKREQKTGNKQFIPMSALACKACPDCAKQLEARQTNLPLLVVEIATAAEKYLRTPTLKGGFLENFVSKYLKNKPPKRS